MRPDQTNESCYRAAQLGALLARHYPLTAPHMIARTVFDMQMAARRARAWEARQCNDPMTEAQTEKGAAMIAALQAVLCEALAGFAADHAIPPLPATVSLGGDPRGPCASLHIPGLAGDGWGEGFAIY